MSWAGLFSDINSSKFSSNRGVDKIVEDGTGWEGWDKMGRKGQDR